MNKIIVVVDMLCPVCRKPLVRWQEMRLETLDEHVFNPNLLPSLKWAYQCLDEKCSTRTHGIFWNDMGDLYIQRGFNQPPMDYKEDCAFINGNNAPFGTFQRKANVEIYKKDENRKLFTFPTWFPGILSGMKVWSNWHYQSNENGDILRKRLSLNWITKDNVYHTWGMRMLCYSIRKDIVAWWELRKDPTYYFWRNQLKGTIEQGKWRNAEWWRKWSAALATFLLKHSPCSPEKPDYSKINVNEMNSKDGVTISNKNLIIQAIVGFLLAVIAFSAVKTFTLLLS
jgi:hypothetical protein